MLPVQVEADQMSLGNSGRRTYHPITNATGLRIWQNQRLKAMKNYIGMHFNGGGITAYVSVHVYYLFTELGMHCTFHCTVAVHDDSGGTWQ